MQANDSLTRTNWMECVLTDLISVPLTIAGSWATARIFVALNSGFGSGDVPNFVYATVPFAFFLMRTTSMGFLLALKGRVNRVVYVVLAIIVGAAGGLLFTLFNRWSLGEWFAAWSFPVLYCWIAGGIAGMFPAVCWGLRGCGKEITQ